jgi:acyl-CoA synthetase (NDP forming)/GNAT superfamily N-acetyltransferase
MSSPSDAHARRLADGATAHIRPLRPDELDEVRALYAKSSELARYLRFFSPTDVDGALRLTPPTSDDAEHCLLAAEVDGSVVALGQYDVTEDSEVAEVAFMVEDDQQDRGLATLLLEALAERATRRGIRRFRAEFLRQNHRMPDVVAHSGFDVRWSCEDMGVDVAEFELLPGDRWIEAHGHRHEQAQARSIARLLAPRSIAVVGAGSGERSIGGAIVTNLVGGGFRGEVHPVNRRPAVVAGRASVASVLDVDGPVDLAVIAVPAAQVLDVARECAEKGAVGIVVVSGGFAELPDGADLQEELTELCRTSGMRLVGPNCVGVINTAHGVSMDATFAPVTPTAGRVGFASQSGGVGIELLARARQLDVGVSTFVSMGNKADVSTNDLLEYWREDDATDVIVLYLESLGNPDNFSRIARRLSRDKPVVALKSGRSAPGARGTRSHTAALADPDAAVDAVLRSAGVIRVDTLGELFDVASLLAHQPVPRGRRVAVMSNGGGPAIVAADACVAAGLDVPELSGPVQQALLELAPTGGVSNPVDLVATATPEVFGTATRVLMDSGEVDALLVIHVAPFVTRAGEIAAAVSSSARSASRAVTVASCYLGLEERLPSSPHARDEARVPTFSYPESAAQALAHAARLGAWRARPSGRIDPFDVESESARKRVAEALEGPLDGTWVPAPVASAVLADYGVEVVREAVVSDAASAVDAARRLGFPVALKATAPGLVHKSDVSGVALDLRDAVAVREAYEQMRAAVGGRMTGGLVQPMVGAGVELIVGIHRDPRFGPLVVVGAGGFTAELEHDSVLLVPPLGDVDVEEAVRSLRCAPLLFGYRGAPPADVASLHGLLRRVGQIAVEIPEVADLDCNPVVVSQAGAVVVDAKMRLVPHAPLQSRFELE